MANYNNTKEWKQCELKIATFNIQGLRSDKKLKSVIEMLKKEKFDIIFLQETYITSEKLPLLEKLWGGEIHLSEGTTRSKGSITLFSRKHKKEDIELVNKEQRILISKIKLKEDGFIYLVNAYGPCSNQDKIIF